MSRSVLRHEVIAHESVHGAAKASCAIPNALGGIDLDEFLDEKARSISTGLFSRFFIELCPSRLEKLVVKVSKASKASSEKSFNNIRLTTSRLQLQADPPDRTFA